MKKAVSVINGAGGVGKDRLCDLSAKHFKVYNVSSITPIKEIASLCGWDGSKDDKSRKFLADLKRVSIEYNDYPTLWAKERYKEFLESEEDVSLVAHWGKATGRQKRSMFRRQKIAIAVLAAISVLLIVALLVVAGIFGQNRNSASKMSWGLLILLLPLFFLNSGPVFLGAATAVILGRTLVDYGVPILLRKAVPVEIAGTYNAWRMILHTGGALLATTVATVISTPALIAVTVIFSLVSGCGFFFSKAIRVSESY